MENKKLQGILKAMEGMTYLEWQKLKHCIDVSFQADVSTVSNKVLLADADKIVDTYQREFV